jgi:hypothetical protein
MSGDEAAKTFDEWKATRLANNKSEKL